MKRLLLVLLMAIICIGAFFGYKYFYGFGTVQAWSFVPPNAVLVYESNNSLQTWEDAKDKKIWQTIHNLSGVNQLVSQINRIDSVNSKEAVLRKLLSNNQLLTVVTPVANDEFDLLYIFEVKNIDQHSLISRILDEKYKTKTRKYAGFKISDVTNIENGSRFSYIFYRNFFVGSSTAFLIEDAIRTITEPESSNFQAEHAELFTLAKLQNDAGNVYVNSTRMNEFLELFIKEKLSFNVSGKSTFLDAKIADDHLLFNGFSLNVQENQYLSVFQDNIGTTLDQLDYIPTSAQMVVHSSFSDSKKYLQNIKNWTRKMSPELWNIILPQSQKYDINFDAYYEWIGDEASQFEIVSSNKLNNKTVAVVETSNIDKALQEIANVADKVAQTNRDSVFLEEYAGKEIIHIPLKEFVASFLGPIYAGFDECYVTSINNQLILANSLEGIKQLVDDMESENVWSKSLKMNDFFNICNKESNLSFFYNVQRGWDQFSEKLNPRWSEIANKNKKALQAIELVGVQFSNVDNKYFTNISLFQPGQFNPLTESRYLKPKYSLGLGASLITKPIVVKNHNNSSLEILVQDSSNVLYLLNDEFEVLWEDSLEYPIHTDVHQVDLFKNGKLQYLYGQKNQLHSKDRNGDDVEGFPLEIGETSIKTLEVVDYNKSKKYRWSITNSNDQVFLTDKEGKKLKGWDPFAKAYKGSNSVRHFRIRGKDIFVLVEGSGIVNLVARNAKSIDGFPLLFDEPIDENYVITAGSSFNNSLITLITKDGELVTSNLQGQLKSREQLIKSGAKTEFSMVKDPNSINFIVISQDANVVTVFDTEGKTKFTKQYISDGPVRAQYYDFGPGNELVILIDPIQELGYIYDGEGHLLSNLPLEVSQELSILYYESSKLYKFFTIYHNDLAYYELKR